MGNDETALALAGSEESSFDLNQVGVVLREKLWLINALTLIGGALGYAYLRSIPRSYFAKAVIQIDPQEVKVVSFQHDLEAQDFANQEVLDSIVATLKSRAFLAD